MGESACCCDSGCVGEVIAEGGGGRGLSAGLEDGWSAAGWLA